MTQEERDLLLKDLYARLPYGVKVNITSRESKNRIVNLTEDNIGYLRSGWWSECKPYLFPLSSMTDEQRNAYGYFHSIIFSCFEDGLAEAIAKLQDWLNKNHFDYRGLIEEGIAIDCTILNIY